jgi:peptidoglycan lytic transglycosylase
LPQTVRRRFALAFAVVMGGTFAALPGSIASGDPTGGTAPEAPAASPAPSGSGTSAPTATTEAVPPPPAGPGQPSLGTPAAVVVGQITTLQGAVNTADAGAAVAVQQKVGDGDWSDLGTTASGSDGTFTIRWKPASVGRVALRAVLADAQGARAADAAPQVDITVFRRTRATWYGPGMYGERTACGKRLTPTLLGVAHKTLPCGTQVQLVYGDQTVTVPVIDRGPYANGASFDLTKATADQLGADGVFRIGYAIIQE